MSLNLECRDVSADCLNSPRDVYIYFTGGFFVWSIGSQPLSVWFNGHMFRFDQRFTRGSEAASSFNWWVLSLYQGY